MPLLRFFLWNAQQLRIWVKGCQQLLHDIPYRGESVTTGRTMNLAVKNPGLLKRCKILHIGKCGFFISFTRRHYSSAWTMWQTQLWNLLILYENGVWATQDTWYSYCEISILRIQMPHATQMLHDQNWKYKRVLDLQQRNTNFVGYNMYRSMLPQLEGESLRTDSALMIGNIYFIICRSTWKD